MGKAIEIEDLAFTLNIGTVTYPTDPVPEEFEFVDYIRFPLGVCINTRVNPNSAYKYQYIYQGESGQHGWRFGSRFSSTAQKVGYALFTQNNEIQFLMGTDTKVLAIPAGVDSGIIKITIDATTYKLEKNDSVITSGTFSGGATTSTYPILLGGINLSGTIEPNALGEVNIKEFVVMNGNSVVYHVKAALKGGVYPCLYDAINDVVASGWNIDTPTTVEYRKNGVVSSGVLLLGNE